MRHLRPLLASAVVISLLTASAAIPAHAAEIAPAAVADAPAAGQYQPLVSARIETFSLAAATATTFSPLGKGGVPASGVSAIAFQLHAQSTGNGLLQVYPSGATRAGTSTVNFVAGQPADNAVISGLGPDGRIAVYNGSTTGAEASVSVDVVGYYTSDAATTVHSTFVPLHPARLVPAGTALKASTPAPIAPLGKGGIPGSGVTAVVAAVSVLPGSTTAGQLVAYPSGVRKPATSWDLKYPGGSGARYTTQITVPIGADGTFLLESTTPATVWVEVAGYFQDSSGTAIGSVYRPVKPARIGGEHIIAADEDPTAVVTFAGQADVPESGASAVVFNLTANSVIKDDRTYEAGAVNVYAAGASPPVARQLSYQADARRWPTQQVSRLSADGRVVLRNTGGGTVRLLTDVLGYYLPDRLSLLPWNSGAAVQPMDQGFIKVFATERGAPVDNVVLFPPRDYWDWMIDYKLWERSLPDKFDKERQDLVMTIPLWTEDRTLETFGTQAEWELLATRMADIDPNAYVRLGWEMNLPSSEWALTDTNRVAWQAAFIQAVQWMKGVAPGLRIVWNPNKGDDHQTCPNDPDCARDAFQVVKDYVDVYAIDSYDSYPAADTAAGRATHLNDYLNESLRYALDNGKKFAVPEWGISCNVSIYPEPDRDCDWAGNAGGDNPAYIELYQDFFAANAEDLAFESYFDEPALYIQSSLIQTPLGPNAPAAYRAGIAANRQ
ncbi:hypothetical protein [Catenuloplanes indicus]|uniref:GH26 domain-containing protein n=1 Tax=Catenuloplanes indicus TaxID=137267 RepID=A0AAE4AWF9_9ACTN|nr:hypothetical protein [Catenuloplanes indicus]MDQ0364967.1 hypothetical protein [Catenuloplanes indicus]